MAEIDLTKVELLTLVNLIQGKSVKVVDPELFQRYLDIEKKILDYLAGPGLDLGGEE